MTRNNNLLGRIDIRGFANLAVRRIAANCRDLLQLHAENRRHGAHANRDRFLHIFAATAHDTDCVREAQSSGGNVRGVFAQAMTGDESGLETFFVQYAPGRDRRGQNRWLRDLGQAKLILGTFEAKAATLHHQRYVNLSW